MKRALLLVALLSFAAPACRDDLLDPDPADAATPVPGEDPAVAPLRGVVGYDQLLRGRLVSAPADFSFTAYLGAGGPALGELTGVWRGVGIKNAYRNGQPNAVNVVVLQLAFGGLGRDLAALCPDSPQGPKVVGLQLKPQLASALPLLCRWPQDEARSEGVLNALWVALAGYDAPEAEFQAWYAHFQGEAYRSQTAAQVIPELVRSALLNPYVLLTP